MAVDAVQKPRIARVAGELGERRAGSNAGVSPRRVSDRCDGHTVTGDPLSTAPGVVDPDAIVHMTGHVAGQRPR